MPLRTPNTVSQGSRAVCQRNPKISPKSSATASSLLPITPAAYQIWPGAFGISFIKNLGVVRKVYQTRCVDARAKAPAPHHNWNVVLRRRLYVSHVLMFICCKQIWRQHSKLKHNIYCWSIQLINPAERVETNWIALLSHLMMLINTKAGR